MGGAASKSTADFITEIAINVMTKNAQQARIAATQTATFKATGGAVIKNIKVRQTLDVVQNAISKNINETDLQTQIVEQIQQTAEAQGTWGAGVASATETSVKDLVSQTFTTENLQKCAAQLSQTVSFEAEEKGMITDVDVEQAMTVFQKCISESITNNKNYTAVDRALSQTATATVSSPLDALMGFFGSTMGIILLIIIGIVIFAFFFGKKIINWIFPGEKPPEGPVVPMEGTPETL
jgi:hypothetical protein